MTRIVDATTDNIDRRGFMLTAYPNLWHTFYTHLRDSDMENHVIWAIFRVGEDPWSSRAEIWIKGPDGGPPVVYMAYENDLYHLIRFSADYTKRDAEGMPALGETLEKDALVKYLGEEYFDDDELVRREFREEPHRVDEINEL